jgi:hypothetical protein
MKSPFVEHGDKPLKDERLDWLWLAVEQMYGRLARVIPVTLAKKRQRGN